MSAAPTRAPAEAPPTVADLHRAYLTLAAAYDPRAPGQEVLLDSLLLYFHSPTATDVYEAAEAAFDRAFEASRARDRERWLLRRYEAAVRLAHRGECPD